MDHIHTDTVYIYCVWKARQCSWMQIMATYNPVIGIPMYVYAGLEKYLNSTFPIRQVNLKFCLPEALPCLPKFSNSLIIHQPKNGSQTTGVF